MLTSYSPKLAASVTITGMMTVLKDPALACEENDTFDDAKEELLLE